MIHITVKDSRRLKPLPRFHLRSKLRQDFGVRLRRERSVERAQSNAQLPDTEFPATEVFL